MGALYHHFPDKAALAAAVYAEVMGEYQHGFLEMLREQQTAEGGIRGGVIHRLRWVAANRGEALLLLAERLDSEALRACNREFYAAIREWWRPHHTYGVLKAMEPAVTAALWLGPAQEYTRYWIASDAETMSDTVIETFATAAWQLVRAEPGARP